MEIREKRIVRRGPSVKKRVAKLELRVRQLDGWLTEALRQLDRLRNLTEAQYGGSAELQRLLADLRAELSE